MAVDYPKRSGASEFLNSLYRWRKFLIINIVLVLILSIIYSLTIDETFKSTAVIMLPKEDDLLGGGQLTGLLSSAAPFLGGKIGSSAASMDDMIGILESRTVLQDVVDRFKLMDYFEIEDNNYDKALRATRRIISPEINDNMMIEINVIHENPDTSALIANYLVNVLDSLNKKFNIQQAKSNREFIEMRYVKNVEDLKAAEDSMEQFQKKYGIYVIPEQVEAAFRTIGEIEAQVVEKEILLHGIKAQLGENSPLVRNSQEQINILKNKLKELQSAERLSDESLILFPFKKLPEMYKSYSRLYRDLEVQGKIMEIIMPLYEKARIDEQKSIPTVIVLDYAVPPQLKYEPKKALVVMYFLFPFLFISLILVARAEKLNSVDLVPGSLEEKEYRFYNRLKKIYRIR
jgi:tyrosine-protein kinase Etk/Wzc